jgi:hypothetical protein
MGIFLGLPLRSNHEPPLGYYFASQVMKHFRFGATRREVASLLAGAAHLKIVAARDKASGRPIRLTTYKPTRFRSKAIRSSAGMTRGVSGSPQTNRWKRLCRRRSRHCGRASTMGMSLDGMTGRPLYLLRQLGQVPMSPGHRGICSTGLSCGREHSLARCPHIARSPFTEYRHVIGIITAI